MLENLEMKEVLKLREKKGREVQELSISDLKKGTLIRATTFSGNTYFFEVVDSQRCTAHVFRCDARPLCPKTGYRGERTVSEVFRVNAPIYHGESQTSWVWKLAIIDY